jgi:ATP:corrinoid adenosyltransferase
MALREYDIIILEEANVAAKSGLISVNDILDLIDLTQSPLVCVTILHITL